MTAGDRLLHIDAMDAPNSDDEPLKPLFLDLAAVADHVSLPAGTVEQLMREGAFPPLHLVPGHRSAWLAREVDAWCEAQPAAPPGVAETIGFEDWKNASVAGE